jgi:hypothetical protein
VGIAVVSFKGLVMFPIAVAFAFQMLTAVSFYQLFLRSLPAGSPKMAGPAQGMKKPGEGVKAVLANPITQSAIITFDDEKTSYDQIKDTLIRDRVYIVGEPEYLK